MKASEISIENPIFDDEFCQKRMATIVLTGKVSFHEIAYKKGKVPSGFFTFKETYHSPKNFIMRLDYSMEAIEKSTAECLGLELKKAFERFKKEIEQYKNQ